MGASSHHWLELGQQAFLDTSLDETDDQTVKTSAGYVIDVIASNPDATTAVYVKLLDAATYDVSAATPTYSLFIPAATTIHFDFSTCPLKFETAIAIAAAQEAGSGATAPATDPVVNVRYG
jgi:hypothetical protein